MRSRIRESPATANWISIYFYLDVICSIHSVFILKRFGKQRSSSYTLPYKQPGRSVMLNTRVKIQRMMLWLRTGVPSTGRILS